MAMATLLFAATASNARTTAKEKGYVTSQAGGQLGQPYRGLAARFDPAGQGHLLGAGQQRHPPDLF